MLKKPGFKPTDCLNFIAYKNLNAYRWYARLLAPLLLATGGGPLFTGNKKEVLWGDFDFDTWMVVRYPSHQGMLKMVANPYYLLVCNPFRKRAVANFELAFTQPHDPESGLHRNAQVLALHANPTNPDTFLAGIRKRAEQAGLRAVYESESRYDFDFITNPAPADTSKLTYPVTIALAADTEPAVRDFARQADVVAILSEQIAACMVLYDRVSKFYYLKVGQ